MPFSSGKADHAVAFSPLITLDQLRIRRQGYLSRLRATFTAGSRLWSSVRLGAFGS